MVGLETLGERDIDAAGVARHQFLPSDAPGDVGLADVGLVVAGLETQELQILRHIRSEEKAVPCLLEAECLRPSSRRAISPELTSPSSQALA